MSPVRIVAALISIVALVGAAAAALSVPEYEPPEPHIVALAPLTSTTTTADLKADALVESETLVALSPPETTLDEKALMEATSTTTTSTTTTTTAPTTTTTAAPATTAAKETSKTSPPTTKAPAPKNDAGYSSKSESQFASSINSYRSSKGLGSLSRDGSLDSYARSWAKRMAEKGNISHSSIGSLLPPWSSVGENVGMGGSVGGIFDALVASSGHRANMLGDFTHMGIGVWIDSSGTVWTAHVFAR